MGHNEATRLLSVISGQVEKGTKSGAGIEITYGQVFGISGAEASVYLAGSRELASLDGGTPEPSDGFRIPTHLSVGASDYVRVSLDSRGHRWIDEVFPTGASPRFKVNSDGSLAWSDGTNIADTNLYRFAANELKTDDRLSISRTGTTDIALATYIPTDTEPRFVIRAGGTLAWGNGTAFVDTFLYRSTVTGRLTTDNNLDVLGGNLYVGQNGTTGGVVHVYGSGLNEGGELSLYGATGYGDWNIDNYDGRIRYHSAGTAYYDFSTARLQIAAAGGISFGSSEDTNLYRGGPNLLVTDDWFALNRAATGDVALSASVNTDTNYRYILQANGHMEWGSGTAARDVNLYRASADILRTDDNMLIGGYLSIGVAAANDVGLVRDGAGILRVSASGTPAKLRIEGAGNLQINNVIVVSERRTGWGTMTGTGAKTGINLETASTAQLGNRLKSLIDDLVAHGLIGA